MLILSRFPSESIVINGNTNIRILSVNGNQVKIGVEAPKEVEIVREELLMRKEEND